VSTVRNDVSATVGLYARGLGAVDLASPGLVRGAAAQPFGDFGAFTAGGLRFGLSGGAGAPMDAGLAARAAVAFIAEG